MGSEMKMLRQYLYTKMEWSQEKIVDGKNHLELGRMKLQR
jgi:hypothetical protein